MIIKKISICGFDRLFEGYRKSEDENRKAYTSELNEYLSNTMISIILSELTTIEMFYLKRFCSNLIINKKEYRNFISKDKEFDINQKIDGLLTLHDGILNDDDIDIKESNIDNILPIGCESYSGIAIFKGSAICAITGGFIDDIFKDDDTKKLSDAYIGNKLMSQKISKLFYEEFYKFLYRKSTDFDIVTSYMMENKFYQYSENICDLANINTPFGEIVFFGNTEDGLNSQIMNIRKNQEYSPYFMPDNIYITFVMNTTFALFMELYLYTNYITHHQNLNVVFADESLSVSECVRNKYVARISNYINYIISYKKEFNNKNIDLNKLNYIFNGSKILYTIQVPLSELKDFSKHISGSDELNIINEKVLQYYDVIHSLVV